VTSLRVDEFFLFSPDGAPHCTWETRERRTVYRGEIGIIQELLYELVVEGVWLDTLGLAADQVVPLHDLLHKCHTQYNISSMRDLPTMDLFMERCSLNIDDFFNYDQPLVSESETRVSSIKTGNCSGGPTCLFALLSHSMFVGWPETKSHHLVHLKFSITRNGFEALLPPSAMEGDCLYHVHGDPSVLVLRPIGKRPNCFRLVGNATVSKFGWAVLEGYYDRRHKVVKPLELGAPKLIALV
jgi:hypothetical protein